MSEVAAPGGSHRHTPDWLVLAIACAALIAAALAWRGIAVAREVPRARRVSALMGRSLVTGPRGAQQPAASATRPRNPTVVP